MAVNRCICANIPFTELRKLADTGIRDLEELGRLTNCGKGCGMCIPYIRVMLATGQTDLPVLTDVQINQLLAARPTS
jgi:bacterioferritin-associated ferredoxin